MNTEAGRPKGESLLLLSFPQGKRVGNPSEEQSERFRTSRNDKNRKLRQKPQGVLFINSKKVFIYVFLCYSYRK